MTSRLKPGLTLALDGLHGGSVLGLLAVVAQPPPLNGTQSGGAVIAVGHDPPMTRASLLLRWITAKRAEQGWTRKWRICRAEHVLRRHRWMQLDRTGASWRAASTVEGRAANCHASL